MPIISLPFRCRRMMFSSSGTYVRLPHLHFQPSILQTLHQLNPARFTGPYPLRLPSELFHLRAYTSCLPRNKDINKAIFSDSLDALVTVGVLSVVAGIGRISRTGFDSVMILGCCTTKSSTGSKLMPARLQICINKSLSSWESIDE